METPEHIRRQRIIGGNIALDLLNTQSKDVLADYGDLLAWSQHVGILTETEADGLLRRSRRQPEDARAAFERARETRSYLHDVFSAIAAGGRPPVLAIDRLQRDETEALAHAKLVAAGETFSWSWDQEDDIQRPLWLVIHAALTLLTVGPLDRVKGCASCSFLFLDESKNRSRRWCSMEACGTNDKMRKYVARRAAVRSAGRES
jgi:predicted RNA-binding Zn ribbon-like protein